MGEDLERLKQRIPLLEYLQRHHWTGHRAGARSEFVGLCPLHEETHPSFYVNPRKNLFYCHGCGRGGDLIRLVELWQHLSFRQSVTYLQEELAPTSQLLEHTSGFYQLELHRHPEGIHYLAQRGVHDPALIEEHETEYRNLSSLYRAASETFAADEKEPRLAGILASIGFGDWTLSNVYSFVYDASMDLDADGRALATEIEETDYAGSLVAALDDTA